MTVTLIDTFQLPLSGSQTLKNKPCVAVEEKTFNSLSRDHEIDAYIQDRVRRDDFQLPLSGSRREPVDADRAPRHLDFQLPLSGSHRRTSSTNLQKTKLHFQLPLSGSHESGSICAENRADNYLSTPSLGITILRCGSTRNRLMLISLSTPSLGITVPRLIRGNLAPCLTPFNSLSRDH